jgi:hypothetical protein
MPIIVFRRGGIKMNTPAHKNSRRQAKFFRLCLAAAMALILPALSTACGGGHSHAGAYANSVFVHNGDVYVAGLLIDKLRSPGIAKFPEKSRAALWKNGKMI